MWSAREAAARTYQAEATSRNSRDLSRAALLAWMTPFEQAESMRFWASRSLTWASGSPASAASSAVLIRVFISDRMLLFAKRRRSFWRFRFSCDLMLAMTLDELSGLAGVLVKGPPARIGILGPAGR